MPDIPDGLRRTLSAFPWRAVPPCGGDPWVTRGLSVWEIPLISEQLICHWRLHLSQWRGYPLLHKASAM